MELTISEIVISSLDASWSAVDPPATREAPFVRSSIELDALVDEPNSDSDRRHCRREFEETARKRSGGS